MRVASPFRPSIWLCIVFLASGITAQAQVPGLIFRPAAGPGRLVLDPNGDGYTSKTSAGFQVNSMSDSEIPFAPVPQIQAEPTGDLRTGPKGGSTDLVQDENGYHSFMYYDPVNQNVLFRMILAGNSSASKGYTFLFNTDFDAFGKGTGRNPGFQFEVVLETDFRVSVYKLDGDTSTRVAEFPIAQHSQRAISYVHSRGTTGYFYDFYVPLSGINSGGIVFNPNQPFRVATTTITRAQGGFIGSPLSDIGGLDDKVYINEKQAFLDVITTFPPATLNDISEDGDGFGEVLVPTKTPQIAGPLVAGEVSVSGFLAEPDGATVWLYKDGVEIGNATVTANLWMVSGLDPLETGEEITARAQYSTKLISDFSTALTVLATAPDPDSGSPEGPCLPVGRSTVQIVSQHGGTGRIRTIRGTMPGLDALIAEKGSASLGIVVYLAGTSTEAEVLNNQGTVVTASYLLSDPDFSQTGGDGWELDFGNGNTGLRTGYSYEVVLFENGTSPVCLGSRSDPFESTTESAPGYVPVFSPDSYTADDTEVSGQVDAAATEVALYRNGVLAGTAIPVNGEWSFNGLVLAASDELYVIARHSNGIWTDKSAVITVQPGTGNTIVVSEVPEIFGSYTSLSTAIYGISLEPFGSVIEVYRNGVLLGTTAVNQYGSWELTGITLNAGDTLTAVAIGFGKNPSPHSNPVTVLSGVSAVPAIVSSLSIASDSITVSTPAAGLVKIYVDEEHIGDYAAAAAGVYVIASTDVTIDGVSQSSGYLRNEFYKGALVTATLTEAGKAESDHSAAVTVMGVDHFTVELEIPGDKLVNEPFNVIITARDQNGDIYSDFTGTATLYSSEVTLTVDSRVTLNFVNGQIVHSVVAVDGGADVQIRVLAVDDPTVSGASAPFVINDPAPSSELANRLEFVQQPVLETAGEFFAMQPTIRTVDEFGVFTDNISNLLPGNSTVTLTLLGGPGTLSGTVTMDLNSGTPGVIEWSDLLVNMPGTNWQLVASNSVLGAVTSGVFQAVGAVSVPAPFGENSLPHIQFSESGPIGLWLANLRGDKYRWYSPSVGLLWRDLVVANYNNNTISVRLCNDNGTFTNPVFYETGLNPFAVRSGFFSSQTFEDVAVANFGTNTVSVFKTITDGTGRLKPRVDYVVGTTPNPGPISISNARASGSAYQDLFIANFNESTVSVLRNDGGEFVLATNIPVGLNPTCVVAVDVDGDSLTDIVTSNQGDHTLTIFRGQPGFQFTHWKTIALAPGSAPSYANVHDLNQDGLVDIVVANRDLNSVSILLQTLDNEFDISPSCNVGVGPRHSLVRDLNRDGKLDIVVANSGGASVDILFGNGDGTFERGGRIPTGRNPMCVAGSNFNNDGATDIAVANYGDDTVSVYLYSGPVAVDQMVTTDQNKPVTVSLKGSLLNGREIGYVILSDPEHGTLTGTPPNLTYTPNRNFVGLDSFQFRAIHSAVEMEGTQLLGAGPNVPTDSVSSVATVTIRVRGVNQSPSFTLATNRIVVSSAAELQVIPNVAVDISAGEGEEYQTVEFLVSKVNRSMYSVTPELSTEGTLVFQPSVKAAGTNVIEIRLKDDGSTAYGGVNTSPAQELEIVVLPNRAPSFELATDLIVAEQFREPREIPGFALNISAGEGEVGQNVTFITTITNDAFFAVKPSISPDGTLTFAPSWSAVGTNYVVVTLRDNGSTGFGGVNQSEPRVFGISVPADSNPFANLKAITYAGLFSDTNNGVAYHSAGFISLKATARMGFSGKLLLDGNAISFSGKFNSDGTASFSTKNRQKKFDKPELNISLALAAGSGCEAVTGTVSEPGSWTAQIEADYLAWVANEEAPFTNNYTMLLPGFSNSAGGPIGSGYGATVVDRKGRVKFSGGLGDGMVLRQSTYVSQDGYWPFFAPGYKVARINNAGKKVVESKGFVMGWLRYQTNEFGKLAPQGNLHWIQTGWTNVLYSAGFTNHNVAVTGSPWIIPPGKGEYPIDLTSIVVAFSEGGLEPNGIVANLIPPKPSPGARRAVDPYEVKGSVARKTGVFRGTFIHPNDGVPIRYFGALLQDYKAGEGYFLGSEGSGKVEAVAAE